MTEPRAKKRRSTCHGSGSSHSGRSIDRSRGSVARGTACDNCRARKIKCGGKWSKCETRRQKKLEPSHSNPRFINHTVSPPPATKESADRENENRDNEQRDMWTSSRGLDSRQNQTNIRTGELGFELGSSPQPSSRSSSLGSISSFASYDSDTSYTSQTTRPEGIIRTNSMSPLTCFDNYTMIQAPTLFLPEVTQNQLDQSLIQDAVAQEEGAPKPDFCASYSDDELFFDTVFFKPDPAYEHFIQELVGTS